MKHLRLIVIVTIVVLGLPASALAAAKILTGTYAAEVGSTSFRFKVIGYTPDRCGTRPGVHCFIALTYPKINEPCPNGQAEDNSFSVPDGTISATGRFSYFQRLSSSSPLISFTAKLQGDHVTGTLREEDIYDDGTGDVTCDSGTLHWHATRH